MGFSYSKSLVILIFFVFASHAYYRIASKKKTLTTRNVRKKKKEIHDVLMFSEIVQSKMVSSKFSRSLIHPSADRLLYYLSLPRHTLDICMYMITYHDIAHLLMKLNNKGVRLRCIVDADMAYATGSATKRIERLGIELRWMKSTNLMHHKFCLIDASSGVENTAVIPFALIGSLNWTNQAISGNWENVLVTSKTEIVQKLQEEFDKLWVKFEPIDK